MSVRLRVFTSSLSAMLTLIAVSMAAAYFLFRFAASPYLGPRFTENTGAIAAVYFPIGGVIALILTGIGALWVVSVMIRSVTAPLRRLSRAVEEITGGNLGYELAVIGDDEFSELAAGFEQMRIRLKNSMREQEKAQTDRRAMIAYITHDLQTPITSIIGYAEGIIDGVAGSREKTLEYADVIAKKSKILKSLAEDLSLLSRLENAQLPLDLRAADFAGVIDELTEDFLQSEPSAKISKNLAPGISVMLDREKFSRVIENILQNSVKYKKPGQAGPELIVSLSAHGGDALLTITDNGIGVPRAELPRLFDQFYRADSSRGKQRGTGLGLSIAKELVLLHGGKIWVLSGGDGGLTIKISLPQKELEQA